MWSLPSVLRAPDTRRGDTASFFALGVFSGIASSCCAPVLAGVMTLSALSGSPGGGTMLGLAFVLGMTFPLFVMALLWDKLRLRERPWLRARPVRLRIAGRALHTNTVNVAVAVGFAVMGGFVIYLAGAQQMTAGPGFQVAIGRWLSSMFQQIQQWLDPVPEPILGLLVLGVAAAFVWATLVDWRAERTTRQPSPQPHCHDHETAGAGEKGNHHGNQ
jgi:cytochrome c biogenesis protein CcdA